MPYCQKCGAEIEEEASYCSKCGAPTGSKTSETTRAARNRRIRTNPTSTAIIIIGVIVFVVVLSNAINQLNQTGVIVGSYNIVTREIQVSDFTSVSVNSGFSFNIKRSDSYKVTVTSNDNLADYIQVYKTNNTLQVQLKPGFSYQSTSLKVVVNMPNLYDLTLNGGANGEASGFSSHQNFVLTSSGGATLVMEGEAKDLTIESSGGCRLDLLNFHIDNAYVNMSGGSEAIIYLDGRLDATLSGGARVLYAGNPTMGTINTSGGSTVSRK